jgi:ribosomal protein S8
MNNYLLGDLVARMRVASRQYLKSIKIIKSKFIFEVINLLFKVGFIRGFFILKGENSILIYLKYNNNKKFFYGIELISKPGRRVF